MDPRQIYFKLGQAPFRLPFGEIQPNLAPEFLHKFAMKAGEL